MVSVGFESNPWKSLLKYLSQYLANNRWLGYKVLLFFLEVRHLKLTILEPWWYCDNKKG